jgi:serine phosphatase RsbU (regulator of sigma subunit)
MIVPLNAHNRTLGAITVLRTRSGRRYETIDLRFAEDLGRRAAISLDNALLHRQVTDVARQLQEVVLPDDLSSLPGWQVSVHYEPGGSSDVGGDFYDAVPLPDGRLALFIGDVMGHGLTAAAAMAQMRAATRAYVVTDPEPAVVLAKLDAMFDVLGMTGLVTLAYSLVDPAANTIRTVNAGHYSPLLVSRDGSVRWLTEETSLPLGAGPASREAIQTELRPDDILFLYTDGLVERRGEIIDRGLDRLIAAAGALAGPDQEDRLAHLVAEVSNSASDDDVTALVVRRLADG